MKWLLPLLFSSLLVAPNWVVAGYSTDLTVENHILTNVNDKAAQEVRIYKEAEVTTVSSDAFNDCSFERIMFSNTVKEVNASFPNTLTTIYFTGSENELEFDIPDNITINFYACDEGFLNFWDTYIRPEMTDSICNVSKENYTKMKVLYEELELLDIGNVDIAKDGTGTIKDSIKFLDNHFSPSSGSRTKEKEISQSVMITLILIIAAFGMTSIGVFYILKDKKVID